MIKRIYSDLLSVDIDVKGAELKSIRSKLNDCEYLWQGRETVWSKHAPVLFPIVGKLKDFTYKIGEESFVLMQHGFAKDLEFRVTSEKPNEICMLLESNEITMEYYPYKFALLAKYTVLDTTLEVEYVVTNLNNKVMPFSIGVHPGFQCPIDKNLSYEDYYLEFNETKDLEVIPLVGGIGQEEREIIPMSSNELAISKEVFSGDAIVIDKPKATQVILKADLDSKKVIVTFPQVPYLGLWSKPLRDSFICIEPWFGMSDFENSTGELIEKEGIQKLLPYQVFQFKYSITIE